MRSFLRVYLYVIKRKTNTPC